MKSFQESSREYNALREDAANEHSRDITGQVAIYNNVIQNEKRDEKDKKDIATYTAKAEKLETEVKDIQKEWINHKYKILYPNFKNAEDQNKTNTGNQMISDAINYLNHSHASDHILKEIKNAFNIGRIDYSSHLIETILSRPTDVTNAKQMQFNESVNELRKELFKDSNLDKVEKEIKDFNNLVYEVNIFKKAVAQGFFNYYPKSEIENASQDFVSKNLESVNESMKFWRTNGE